MNEKLWLFEAEILFDWNMAKVIEYWHELMKWISKLKFIRQVFAQTLYGELLHGMAYMFIRELAIIWLFEWTLYLISGEYYLRI